MTDLVTVLVKDEQRKPLEDEAVKASGLAELYLTLEVTSPADEQFAVDVRAHAKARIDALEEQRFTIAKPLGQAKAALDALFRPARKAYEDVVRVLDAKLSAYATAQRELARQEATRLLAEGKPHEPPPPPSTPAGVDYRESWQAELVDLKALILAEAEAIKGGDEPQWLMLRPDAVKAFLEPYANSTEVPPVPGLKFSRVAKPRTKR